ncbi:hypothetical protein MN112_09590 [Staphylococcus epidermidis]|uniref:DUF3102 domain-containing protein n=1 Tax=Staphylococcus phage HS15 TaxID=3056405 RepID=A0AA49X339_9VIRU|nr:hypothetical protein [Staphylococcus epidermidis]WLJ26127.1 MAG: protein of unknown function (DUF3102) [Staphylococcus phage HS15]MCG1388625.1 hypothetical protein [Staphylococcus epidermidis]MCG1574818.1 hypothetical protein [Staphylococcus epidermidis]MCG2279164.1 hypothetical protein [Staphylococcus epidermidis]MCG2397627.1 hypothetical protein [Staphylococcus epidermidis]
MNELEQQEFDYSLVDNEIANKLKKYDEQLNRLYNNYTIEVGEILYNANKEFSNPKDGTFIKWVEYKGFKRQSAYNYMSVYKAFQNLESIDDQKNFLSQPKTLQYEMSKPSANKEANEAVLNGEVKSTKEYKELERKLKQRDEQNSQLQSQVEQAQRSESIARKKLEDEQNREPEIKREVKEVIPPHVKAQLSDRQQMIDAKDKEIKQLQERLTKAEEQKQKFEKQDYLEEDEQIASISFQVESTVLEIKDNINRFLNENASTAFREAAIARASEKTKNQIYDGVEELEAFCRTMRQSLNSNVIVGG